MFRIRQELASLMRVPNNGRGVLPTKFAYSSKKGLFSEIIDSVKNEVSKDDELRQSLMKMEARLTDVNQNAAIRAVKDATKNILSSNSQLVERISHLQRKGDELIKRRFARRKSPRKPFISEGSSRALDTARNQLASSKFVQNLSASVENVQSTIVDSSDSLLYGGFSHREARRRALNRKRLQAPPAVEENPNAGTSITLSGESIKSRMSAALSSAWNAVCEENPIIRKAFEVRRAYEESNNVFVFLARSLTSTITSPFKSLLFKESEIAQVVKEIRAVDPSFSVESFISEATKFIIPDILEAFIHLDRLAIKRWCSESLYATLTTALPPNIIGEGQVLDLRHVDLLTARIVNDFPVLVISFNTQQISCVKDSVTGKITRGSLDTIENMLYVWALAKTPDVDPLTGGWRLIEMSARDARSGF